MGRYVFELFGVLTRGHRRVYRGLEAPQLTLNVVRRRTYAALCG